MSTNQPTRGGPITITDIPTRLLAHAKLLRQPDHHERDATRDELRAVSAELESIAAELGTASQRTGKQAFERWYVVNAFDYANNPLGSRDCALQWAAWHGALSAQQAATADTWMPLQHTGLAIRMDLLNEEQAQRNHGQSLRRLAERGGLSPTEAAAVIDRRAWKAISVPEAMAALQAHSAAALKQEHE